MPIPKWLQKSSNATVKASIAENPYIVATPWKEGSRSYNVGGKIKGIF